MLVDTQPATHQHLPATQEVRDQWVDSQLIGMLMDKATHSLLAAGLALPILVFMMFNEVHMPSLFVWAGGVVVLLVLRYRMIGLYRLRLSLIHI